MPQGQRAGRSSFTDKSPQNGAESQWQNDILKLINNRERFNIKPPQKLPLLTRLTLNKSSGSALTRATKSKQTLTGTPTYHHICMMSEREAHSNERIALVGFGVAFLTSPLPVHTGSLLQAVTRPSQCSQQQGLNQSVGSLGSGHWGITWAEPVDHRLGLASPVLTVPRLVPPPANQSPYCHLSSHWVVYSLEGAGEPSSLGNGCAITALSLKVITHISWLFFTAAAAAEPMGGKWQWSGLPRCCIKPQVGEIALTPQALQITTLSRLNATAISKETGYIFHHRRGARFRAREAAASCLALFLDRGRWSVVKEELHSSGTSFH